MQVLQFTEHEDWLNARKTRITGSRLKNVLTLRGDGKKKDFYDLIAERMELPKTDENPMDRGHRLEPIALDLFSKETGKKIDNSFVMWVRDDDVSIGVSPDGVVVEEDGTVSATEILFAGPEEAVEVKCLDGGRHIEALLTGMPNDYKFQVYQYFIVNDNLKTLYMVFYNPRLIAKQLHWLEIKREDVEDKVRLYHQEQRNIIAQVEEIVTSLTF